jgi:hypothetical protein
MDAGRGWPSRRPPLTLHVTSYSTQKRARSGLDVSVALCNGHEIARQVQQVRQNYFGKT